MKTIYKDKARVWEVEQLSLQAQNSCPLIFEMQKYFNRKWFTL